MASALLDRANYRAAETRNLLGDQVHTAQLAAETLLATLQDAETGQRGYLLTGNPAYLAPYDKARAQLDGDLDQLAAAPLADPARRRTIGHIRVLASAKLDELGRTIALQQAGRTEMALAIVRSDVGEELMEALRQETSTLQSDGDARLARAQLETGRLASNRAASWVVTGWGGVLGLAAVASLLFGWVALVQHRARLHATASLQHLQRFTRAFGLAQGILRDIDGRITFWSAGSERLYGFKAADAVGRVSHELLRTEFPLPLAEINARLLRDGQWQGNVVHRSHDGCSMNVASRWMLHRGEAGENDAVIEVHTNITSLKRAEAELREGALRLRLALDASSLGIWRWEVGGNGEMEWDARCKALFGLAADAPVDHATWVGAIAPEDRSAVAAGMARALDPADPNDQYIGEYRAVQPDGTALWIAATGRALFEVDAASPAGRRPLRLLCTVCDVSAARQAARDRQRDAALLRAIIETAPGLIYAKDRSGRMLLANQPVLALIGKSWAEIEGRTAGEFLDDPAQAEAVMAREQRLMAAGHAETTDEVLGFEDGHGRVWFSTRAPLRDAADAVIGLVGLSVEITGRKQAENRLRLMVNELNHRTKNILATVQAVALQTLRGADAAMRERLDGRLLALAAVHDVLTRESWEGVALDEVVTRALAVGGGVPDERYRMSGPRVRLNPVAAQALAMSLHELATNATRHGALSFKSGSTKSGRVEIRWEVIPAPSKATPSLLRLTWTERGGPAVVAAARRGFGSRLVEQGLAHDFGGTVRLDLDDPDGITCLVELPLAELVASAEIVPFPRVGTIQGDFEQSISHQSEPG